MKWIKRLLIFIVVLIILAIIAGIIFIKTFDASNYKHIIEQKVSAQIDREVTIGDIALKFSLQDGLSLQLDALSIKEEPARQNDFIMKVDSVQLDVDLMAFLMEKEIIVFGINIKKPEFYFVRDSDGALNIDDVVSNVQKTQISLEKKTAEKNSDKPTSQKEEFNIFVNAIEITDASIHYIDGVEPATTIDMHSLDCSVNSFSFNKDFDFNLKFGLLSSEQNILVKGFAFVNPAKEEVLLKNANISVELDKLDTAALIKLIPQNEQLKDLEELGGMLNVEIRNFKYSKNEMEYANLYVQLSDGIVKVASLEKPFDQIQLTGKVDNKDLVVQELSFYYGSGQGQLDALINNYLLAPSQEFYVSLDNFKAEEILSSFELPIDVEGRIDGHFKGQAQGMTPEMVQKTLLSDGEWKMTDGVLKDINVLKLVLSKLSFIPNLVDQIEEKLPPTYKEKLKSEDTVLNLVESDMTINNGRLYFHNTKVDADGFVLTLNGDLNFDQYLNLRASFSIPFELSQLMVASTPDLSVLLDGDNIIRIPLKSYSGKLDKFVIYPDIGDMAQKVIRNRGREELQKVIFKALDLDEDPPQDGVDQRGVPEGEQIPTEAKPPEQEAIENILDMIFQ